jgi:hypothetical protein
MSFICKRTAFIPLLLWAAVAQAAQVKIGSDVRSALDGIHADALRAHMAYLASDDLQGRGVGTPGYDLAAKYVSDQFQSMGLEPGAGEGSFYQVVPMRETEVIDAASSLKIVREGVELDLTRGTDYVLSGDASRESVDIEAPVVFAGYGIYAPENNHDDYGSLDLKNKVVAVFGGAPKTFTDDQRNYYESPGVKWNEAHKRGAAAMIFLIPERSIAAPGHTMAWQVPGATGNPLEITGAAVLLSRSGISALFHQEGRTIAELALAVDSGGFASFGLSTRIHLHVASRYHDLQSANIVGRLRGSDPALKDQYVAITAHLDHLGVGPALEGDSIYNGALDNAAGVALMLEAARAFTKLPVRPKRSILFVAFTGEEAGELGSDFFVHYCPVALKSIVADVNLDSTTALYPLLDIAPLGAADSTLDRDVRAAADALKLEVSPDPLPEEGFFMRSDQFSFVLAGVPSVFVNEGVKTADPKVNGLALMKNWMATIYHTPKDDMTQPIVFQSVVKQAQVNFLITYLAAQDTQRPQWESGDFFGDKFGGKP